MNKKCNNKVIINFFFRNCSHTLLAAARADSLFHVVSILITRVFLPLLSNFTNSNEKIVKKFLHSEHETSIREEFLPFRRVFNVIFTPPPPLLLPYARILSFYDCR